MKQGSILSYLHHDHLGSLVAATDPSGAEVGWASHSPFGQLRLSGGNLPSDRLFLGQTRDNVLGAVSADGHTPARVVRWRCATAGAASGRR